MNISFCYWLKILKVEYVQDDMKDDEAFQKIFDGFLKKPMHIEETAGKYFNVVSACLKKHSTRPPAVEVSIDSSTLSTEEVGFYILNLNILYYCRY